MDAAIAAAKHIVMGDDRVSRMAAVLVLAAGGRIRVPIELTRRAHLIRLHQDDREPGFVTYSATPFDRPGQGAIIDATATVVEQPRRLPDQRGED